MRYILFALLLVLISPLASADEIVSRVTELDPAQNTSDVALVFFETDGRVLRIAPQSPSGQFFEQLEQAQLSGETLRVKFIDAGLSDEVMSVEKVSEADAAPISEDPFAPGAMDEISGRSNRLNSSSQRESIRGVEEDPLSPQTLNQPENAIGTLDALDLFSYLRSKKLRKSSQCFHRAYLWGYDMYNQKRIESAKVFAFFSKAYIRKYRFKWWFHVAPMIRGAGGDHVLDATYTEGPRSVQGWLNDFMPAQRTCVQLDRFLGRASLTNEHDCYLRFANMYVYGSNHLARVDRQKSVPRGWMKWALNQSSRNARP